MVIIDLILKLTIIAFLWMVMGGLCACAVAVMRQIWDEREGVCCAREHERKR